MFFIVRIVATHYVLTINYYNSVIHGMARIVQSAEKKYKKVTPPASIESLKHTHI